MKTEEVLPHHISKYIRLSQDDIDVYMHTPTKTLFMLVDHHITSNRIRTKDEYIAFYSDPKNISLGFAKDTYDFGDSVIFNDYPKFMDKVVNYFKFMGN